MSGARGKDGDMPCGHASSWVGSLEFGLFPS
jgi:hypothetical protein